MKYYIYLDVFFFFNVLMDFFLLLFVWRWNHCKRSWWYCGLAGIIGGCYAVWDILFRPAPVAEWILTYVVVGQVMIGISMDWRGIREHLTYLVQLYLGTFFCSGMIATMGVFLKRRQTVYQLTGISGQTGAGFQICMIGFSYIIFSAVLKRMKYHIQNQKNIMKITVTVAGKKEILTALCDTGNRLVEPMTGKPVCVISKGAAERLMLWKEKPVLIPYNTIDRKSGMMQGAWVDCIYVNHRQYQKIPIAIQQRDFSERGAYEIILPPELFEKRGEKHECGNETV